MLVAVVDTCAWIVGRFCDVCSHAEFAEAFRIPIPRCFAFPIVLRFLRAYALRDY